MRIATLALSLYLLTVGTAAAQTLESLEPGAIVTSDDALPKMTFRAGTSTIDMRASRRVDISELLVAAKIKPNDAPELIVDKVNAVRKRLYPQEEISLIATGPRTSGATQGVTLYRQYVYWNRTGGVWWYYNSMAAGVTFMNDVRGDWNYYECNNCSSWRYMYRIMTGGSLSRVLYGGYYRRGFNYAPRVYGSRADIIMYFLY